MRLDLAVVVGHDHDGCSVVPLGRSGTLRAAFAQQFRRRAGSLPGGSLVALDVEPATPEVVWRWFPARVLTVTAEELTLDEPVHGVIGARVGPALSRLPGVGEGVYVAVGLTDDWRIDASEDDPGAAASVLPEIAAFYARMRSGGGVDAEPAGG